MIALNVVIIALNVSKREIKEEVSTILFERSIGNPLISIK
jgi:hypothetical protein